MVVGAKLKPVAVKISDRVVLRDEKEKGRRVSRTKNRFGRRIGEGERSRRKREGLKMEIEGCWSVGVSPCIRF